MAAWLDTIDDTDLAISVISVREIAKGIEKKSGKPRKPSQTRSPRLPMPSSPPTKVVSFL
ncbi:PilT domain-containing protein (plasmid) [Rhizobium etli bv. mimosae str. Mim1]|nr:PilT domain-containing protein [Rhizobium etli bv. mimosae str. Mim1]